MDQLSIKRNIVLSLDMDGMMGDVSLLSECGWHEDEAEPGEYRCHYM